MLVLKAEWLAITDVPLRQADHYEVLVALANA
jgi:hypothetical protein